MEFKISSEDEEVLEETQGNSETRMDGVDSVEYGRMKQESAEEENTDAHKRFMEEEPLVIKQTDIPKRESLGGNILTDRKSVNVFMIISAGLLLVALFLPYMKISLYVPDGLTQEVAQVAGESQEDKQIYTEAVRLLGTSISLYGVTLLGCAIAQIVFAVLKKNRFMKIGSAVVVVIIVRLVFRYFLTDTMTTGLVKMQVASGFTLLIISGIAMLISAFYRDFIGKPNVNED